MNAVLSSDHFSLGYICIHMLGMSGLDLLQVLHQQGITPPVFLIAAMPDSSWTKRQY
jgi:hypothetical protein